MKSVLAADLGGSKCRFARVTADLRVVDALRFDTPTEADDLLEVMTRSLREIARRSIPDVDSPNAIGIGTAGVVVDGGRALDIVPNLPFGRGFGLADAIESRCELPTQLVNDGRASAIGEYAHGRGRGRDPLLALFFGTGIGVGLIVRGRAFAGAGNAAGEIGHMLFEPGGRLCRCGRRGCFEAYAGGGPLTERAGATHVDEVVARAAAGDATCKAVLDEARRAACTLVANCCTLFNPAAVVLGGGVFAGWPDLRGDIESFALEWCTEVVQRDLAFFPATGGSDAILRGAAISTGAFDH